MGKGLAGERSHDRPRVAWIVLTIGLVAIGGCTGESSEGETRPPFWDREIVDLTHTFDETTIYWPTATHGWALTEDFAGDTPAGHYYSSNSFSAPEHGGTHLDAPIHFYRDRSTTDRVPVDRLIGPAAVIDVEAACAADPDYMVTIADLQRWETAHGRLPDGAIVLLRTGFGRHWPERERYLGTAILGDEAIALLHFPGLDPAAARWLAVERSIGAVGLDTASIDRGQSKEFGAHVALMEYDIPVFENVASLDRLPASGAAVIALPVKIGGGSGGPLRIVAVLGD